MVGRGRFELPTNWLKGRSSLGKTTDTSMLCNAQTVCQTLLKPTMKSLGRKRFGRKSAEFETVADHHLVHRKQPEEPVLDKAALVPPHFLVYQPCHSSASDQKWSSVLVGVAWRCSDGSLDIQFSTKPATGLVKLSPHNAGNDSITKRGNHAP